MSASPCWNTSSKRWKSTSTPGVRIVTLARTPRGIRLTLCGASNNLSKGDRSDTCRNHCKTRRDYCKGDRTEDLFDDPLCPASTTYPSAPIWRRPRRGEMKWLGPVLLVGVFVRHNL